MIDHISLRVNDFDKAVDFYKAALQPLGYEVLMQFPGAAGLGADGKADFWIMQSDKAIHPTHLAFSADRKTVDAFHAAALAAGGTDHGAPGLRADYHPNYYGAFILDAEGNNVEAVSHAPEGGKKSASKSAKKPAKKATGTKKGATKSKAAAKPAKGKKAAKPVKGKKAAPKTKKAAKPAKAKAMKKTAKPAPKAKKAAKGKAAKAAPKAKKAAPKAKKTTKPAPKAKKISRGRK